MTIQRSTKQKQAIRQILEEAKRPLSPQELFKLSKSKIPGINLTTIYRNLNALVVDKVLCAVEIPGTSPRYEAQGLGHHHHFQCQKCEKVFDIPACHDDLEALVPKGFELEGHELFLFGKCSSCRPKKSRKVV